VIDFALRNTTSAAIRQTGPRVQRWTLTTRIAVLPSAKASERGQFFPWEEMAMAKVTGLCVGESLVGDGNEVAHIDLIMGPRGSSAETAFVNCLTNNKDGFTSLLAVVGPNLMTKPATVMFNKVTIKGAKQAVQMFGPAQHAVAKAVADSVADGTIPADEADNIFICVGVFIHWEAADDKKIQEYNYRATKEALERAVKGEPKAAEVVKLRDQVKHPFAA
jgi:5,6,7,8-tetrahydromethanopterin hydro-lyase